MALVPRALTRPRVLLRCLSVVVLCVCSLMLYLVYTEMSGHFTSLQLKQGGLDSVNGRRLDGVKERNTEPFTQKRLLKEPSVHLEEGIQAGHDAVLNTWSRVPPTDGVIADNGHLIEVDPAVDRGLNSTSLESRGRYQKLAIKTFCSRHPTRGLKPYEGTRQSKELYKHLLYDDETKIIFCYIPKVGCSNWKRMFAVLQKLINVSNPRSRPPENVLSAVPNLFDLGPAEREVRLKSYFKFVMVRNPFERIVSVYRNKILPPFMIEHRGLFPEKEKHFMLKRFESARLSAWWSSSRDKGISPSFETFLRYLIFKQGVHVNEHFLPMVDLCYPCVVDYDVFISFKNLPDDAFKIMDMFNIPHDYYRNIENHPYYSTSNLVELYFGGMNEEERREYVTALNAQAAVSINEDNLPSSPPEDVVSSLVDAYKDELDFYYTLHPEERAKYSFLRSLTPHANMSTT